MIGRAWTAWVDALSVRESATSVALFRIGMGMGVILTVGSVVAHRLVPVLWLQPEHGGMRDLGEGPWLVALLGGPTPGVVWPIIAGALLGGALLLAGVGGRWAAILALVCTNNVVNINGHTGGSYDELLTNGLWLTVLGPGHQTLSVAARLRTGSWWPEAQALAFPRWLAIWQLVIMYCATGLQKLSFYWVPGGDASALYYILQQPTWQRVDMQFTAWLYPLTQIGTTLTWFWEVLAPLWFLALVWSARPARAGRCGRISNRIGLRWWFFGIGLVLHVLIFVTMEVGPFTYLSLVYYVATVHPWEWDEMRDASAVARVAA
jgi:hypothetical protein